MCGEEGRESIEQRNRKRGRVGHREDMVEGYKCIQTFLHPYIAHWDNFVTVEMSELWAGILARVDSSWTGVTVLPHPTERLGGGKTDFNGV